MSNDQKLAIIREETSLMPDFLGLSAVWTLFYILLCVIALGAVSITTLSLDLPAVGILGAVLVVVVVEAVVGIALAALAVVSPTYLSTREFVARQLRVRFGQQAFRHDDVASRTFPDFAQFDDTTNTDVTDTNE